MMITGATPCYPNMSQNTPIYGVSDHQEVISSSLDENSSSPDTHPTSFLYNLSVLRDKIHQLLSVASIFLSPDHGRHPESTVVAMPTMGTLIQEIIVTASSMMFACQQMSLRSPPTNNKAAFELHPYSTNKIADAAGGPLANAGSGRAVVERAPSSGFSVDHHDAVDQWYGESYNNCNSFGDNNNNHGTALFSGVDNSFEGVCGKKLPQKTETIEESQSLSIKNCDIVELDAADILAKYTHYCQVCGKGFKRDANLRMHMRAHGDEYKSRAALSNPLKNAQHMSEESSSCIPKLPRKYSCPQEGCRWNKNHAKFQPMKSMICVKNHYKRSHCPKMYVCKRCNRKQFSVLSDLRTHEKQCGDDLKWMCSCGTTFSRKDKLMGHVALFVGHTPAVNSLAKKGNGVQNTANASS